MKRRVLTITVFLLLGAIVNVAVAWGCAAFVDIYAAPETNGRVGGDSATWFITYRKAFGSLHIGPRFTSDIVGRISPQAPSTLSKRFAQDVSEAIPPWSTLHEGVPTSWDEVARQRMDEDARGWPTLSLRCSFDQWTIGWRNDLPPMPVDSFRIDGDVVHVVSRGRDAAIPLKPGDGVRGGRLTDVQRISPGSLAVRAIPLRPIWPGFAINTVFYAGILWLLFAAPFALRRRRRIKRGLCPACAYPVGDSTVCTECGQPVKQRSPLI